MCFKLLIKIAYTIANLLPSQHLHFDTDRDANVVQICQIFHPVNVSIILRVQSPTRSRKTLTVREFKPEIEGVMRSNVEFSLYS